MPDPTVCSPCPDTARVDATTTKCADHTAVLAAARDLDTVPASGECHCGLFFERADTAARVGADLGALAQSNDQPG